LTFRLPLDGILARLGWVEKNRGSCSLALSTFDRCQEDERPPPPFDLTFHFLVPSDFVLRNNDGHALLACLPFACHPRQLCLHVSAGGACFAFDTHYDRKAEDRSDFSVAISSLGSAVYRLLSRRSPHQPTELVLLHRSVETPPLYRFESRPRASSSQHQD